MKKTHDLVAVIKREGREKPNYIRCGAAFTRDDGSMAIKVDSIPACDWNGWLSLFEPREKDAAPPAKPGKKTSPAEDFDDDIAF